MRELTKHAVETFYQDDLKHRLKEAFNTLMSEMKGLPDEVYHQYATNALKNLIQLSAKGVSDLNVVITESLNDSEVLYANYEEDLKAIKVLDEIALAKKYELETYYEEYRLKKAEYERFRQEYDEEKGMVEQDEIESSTPPESDEEIVEREDESHE